MANNIGIKINLQALQGAFLKNLTGSVSMDAPEGQQQDDLPF